MATFRSNLNSVSSTYGLSGLQTLRRRITTCFQNWRCKTITKQQQQQDQNYCKQQQPQQEGQQYFEFTFREYSFVSKTSNHVRNFNTKLKKLLPTPKKKSKNNQGKKEHLEIVAKLLSSTLIATTVATTATTTEVNCKGLEDSSMTITDDTFLRVRHEYPDLDAEVRSILLARAQDGATISEIKEDYRKSTGTQFPIYKNITEFLLSIPYVSAMCNMNRTRIFNIVPTEKTRHLYELVMLQKPAQQFQAPPAYSSGQGRLPSYTMQNRRQMWRNNDHGNFNQRDTYNNDRNNNNNNKYLYNQVVPPQNSADLVEIDKNRCPNDSDYLLTENGYYKDNCNHFYSRFYNQEHFTPLPTQHLPQQHNNNNMPIHTKAVDNINDNDIDKNNCELNNLNGHILKTFNNDLTPTQRFRPQQQQRPPALHKQPNAYKNNNVHNRDNGHLKRKRLPSRSRSPTYTRSSHCYESYCSDSDYEAHLLDFPLLGDDFFLYLARMELKCKFKQCQKVLQSGLCVSGQTINGALRRVRKLADRDQRVIVNIGSVDIMQGKPLVQIEHDFRELVNVMHKKGLTPILTTLAPLANYAYDKEMRKKLQRFNEFIKREGQYLLVIDIWSCLVNDRQHALFGCFQSEPRNVTGAAEYYLFWNKIGRQRVLQLIESQIEY